MKFSQTIPMTDANFKRLTGVKRETFFTMVDELQKVRNATAKKYRGGRKPTLCLEDMLLLTLSYLRSYMTYFEIGAMYQVSESTAHRTVIWVEDALISCGRFSLPSKKVLSDEAYDLDVVLIDVTEQEIERPKKNSDSTILERKRNTR